MRDFLFFYLILFEFNVTIASRRQKISLSLRLNQQNLVARNALEKKGDKL